MHERSKSFLHWSRRMMGWGVIGLWGMVPVACQPSQESTALTGASQPLSASASQPSPRPPSPVPPPAAAPPLSSAHPANVMFLLDNNESMQDFTQSLPEDFTPGFYPPSSPSARGQRGYVGAVEGDFTNTGCSDPALVSAMSWFDKNSTDVNKNGSVSQDSDPDFGGTPFFEANKFYHARGRRVAWQVEDYPYSVSARFDALNAIQSTLSACYQVVNWNTSDYYSASTELMDECQACLASKGWWRGPRITSTTGAGFKDSDYPPEAQPRKDGQPPPPPEAYRKWVVSGGVLNVHPPRFVAVRKALKDVIGTATHVRMGVASFGGDRGWFDPPWVLQGMSPSCDQSYPVLDEQALNRSQLAHAVNQTLFRHNERATGESLFGLGGYFSSQVQDGRWQTWFQQPIGPGFFGWPGCCDGGTYDNPDTGQGGASWGASSDEWLKAAYTDPSTGQPLPGQPWEGTGNDKSVCFADQTTAIIVVTGGSPRYDNSVPITKMMSLLKANGARNPDGTLVQFDPSSPATNPNVGGINDCDQVVKNPATGEKYTKADCDYTQYNWPVGLGAGNKNFMDDVSFFLAHTDLRGDLPGDQTVRTYVVGYGDSSPINQSISLAGQGQFYRADTGAQLQQAVQQILSDL